MSRGSSPTSAFKKKLYLPLPSGPLLRLPTQRTKSKTRVENADERSIERATRQLLSDKISGNHVGIWLLIPEYLRLGTWDLLCGWSGHSTASVHPRLALHLVNEAAFCTSALRRNRSLSQRGFEVANGLPWVPTDKAIHDLLDAHTVAEAEALQIAHGKIRRATGHFKGKLLAIDPHRMRSSSKRQMRRHRPGQNEAAFKTAQSFFALDADTHQPVCFTVGSSAQTVTQATPRLLDLAAEILGPMAQDSLVVADTEHYTVELLDHVHLDTPFELLVPAINGGKTPGPDTEFVSQWPGYATAQESFAFKNSRSTEPYSQYIQRCGEVPGEYTYKNFVCTTQRDEVAAMTKDFPKRWHVEEFFKLDQALGWQRAGTLNLNIRCGQMTFAMMAQTAISQMRQRLGEPFQQWDATHLARSIFGGLDGDVRVENDTIVVTFYNAPETARLREHYENLPEKLAAEGVDPHVPWLWNFKLDFRFR